MDQEGKRSRTSLLGPIAHRQLTRVSAVSPGLPGPVRQRNTNEERIEVANGWRAKIWRSRAGGRARIRLKAAGQCLYNSTPWT